MLFNRARRSASLSSGQRVKNPTINPMISAYKKFHEIGQGHDVNGELHAAQRERDKPRQGVVANTLNLFRNGAVGVIDWLGAKCSVTAQRRIAVHLPRERSTAQVTALRSESADSAISLLR